MVPLGLMVDLACAGRRTVWDWDVRWVSVMELFRVEFSSFRVDIACAGRRTVWDWDVAD